VQRLFLPFRKIFAVDAQSSQAIPRVNPCRNPQKVASSSGGVLHTRHAQLDARAHEAP
jgi:hypothetical protein